MFAIKTERFSEVSVEKAKWTAIKVANGLSKIYQNL